MTPTNRRPADRKIMSSKICSQICFFSSSLLGLDALPWTELPV
jgi:hypothetical protein